MLILSAVSVIHLCILQNGLILLRLWLRVKAIINAEKVIAPKAIIAVEINIPNAVFSKILASILPYHVI
jgi:hypothetical protein